MNTSTGHAGPVVAPPASLEAPPAIPPTMATASPPVTATQRADPPITAPHAGAVPAGAPSEARRGRGTRGPLDPRLLRHARSSRAGIAALALLGAGQAAATLAVAVALSLIVAGSIGSAWSVGSAWSAGSVGGAVALLAGAFAARALLSWAEQVVAQRTAARVTAELRSSLLSTVLRRGPAWAAAFGSGRLTTVLTTGLDALRPWFGGYLPALILGVTLPPLVVVAMALVDPASALIALVTLPLIPVLGALIGWATQARARQRWQADARLAGHFLDVVRGLPTLRVFGRAARQTDVIEDLTDRHRAATMRVLRVAFLSSTALDLVGTLSVGLIAVEAGLRVAAGDLPLGPALLVILLAPEAYRPLREMAARYHASTDATAVITDVDEILTDAPAAAPALAPAPGSAPATGPAPALALTETAGAGATAAIQRPATTTRAAIGATAAGLRVRYPGASRDALDLESLIVRGGEIVALRGPSGAGKTTALRVLAGVQAADAGVADARRPLYLPQRPMLPHARLVSDLFPPGTNTADIAEALATVGLTGEVTATTPLGDHGSGVSAGQRHRLALAALLHRAGREPATLLLDEPTAHLDAATEALVITRLQAAADTGSAVLVVAHRPALLAAATRQVELTAPAAAPTTDPVTIPATNSGTSPTAGLVGDAAASPTPATAGVAGNASSPEPPGTEQRPTQAGWRRARWWRAGFAVALSSGSSLAGIVLTGAAAWLLVRASSLPPVLTLSAAVVLVRGSAVARPLLRYLERLVAHDVAFARLGARRARIYATLVPRVPGPRLRRRGDLLSKVVDDVDAQVDGLLRGRLPAVAAAVTTVVAFAVFGLLAPAALIPVGAGLLISAVLAPALAARQATRADAATGTARARLRDAVVETVDGLEDLAGRADGVPQERSNALGRLEARAARSAGGAAALAHLGWGVAVVGTALSSTALTPEWAAVLLLAVVVLGETILPLPDAAVARRRAAGADRRLAELSATPPPANFPQPSADGVTTYGSGGVAVSVTGLEAGWDNDKPPVLRGLDLELPAGSRTAVLGRSGSGKSTLGAVLARLLDPRAGLVTLNGIDVRELPEDRIRGRVVLVGDDTGHVFASTVRENLRLARPAADDEQLRKVLARVRLDDWLDTLPDGLDTWLGSGGSTMSGGQARRFAVARALLAEPALLILDEPTEGLDADVAEDMMADLLDATGGPTVLLLTHRREGLGHVDRVVRLSE